MDFSRRRRAGFDRQIVKYRDGKIGIYDIMAKMHYLLLIYPKDHTTPILIP